MRNYNITTEDLDELLKAHNEHKFHLSRQELELIEKIRNNDTSVLRFHSVIDSRIKEMKNLTKLDEKLEKEFKEFYEQTKEKSVEEIIDRAYELTVKEELKDTLKGKDIFPLEVIALLKQEDILNEFYHDWLNVDIPLGEVLEASIDNSICMVTRYYEEKKKEKNEARQQKI